MTTVDIAGLLQAVDRKRVEDQLSWRALAAHIGLSSSLFTRMARGHKPDLNGFASIVTYLGEDPRNFFIW